MWTISEIKEQGKAAFRANYWPSVGVAFLMMLFMGGSTVSSRSPQGGSAELQQQMQSADPAVITAIAIGSLLALGIAFLIKIFLSNPIELGGYAFFKSNVEAPPAPFGTIKVGFQNYWHNFVVLFLRDLFLLLWFMLLIIPGFIKLYSYAMVPFILAENPDMSATEVITRSREMMNGNKWRAFVLDLSFIGWILLGIVTLGLGLVFWTTPYMHNTHAALYLELKEQGA